MDKQVNHSKTVVRYKGRNVRLQCDGSLHSHTEFRNGINGRKIPYSYSASWCGTSGIGHHIDSGLLKTEPLPENACDFCANPAIKKYLVKLKKQKIRFNLCGPCRTKKIFGSAEIQQEESNV